MTKQQTIDRLTRENDDLKTANVKLREYAYHLEYGGKTIYYRDEFNIVRGRLDEAKSENEKLYQVIYALINPEVIIKPQPSVFNGGTNGL